MRRGLLFAALAVISLAGCRHRPGPEAMAAEYARALREGRLDDAWSMTAHGAAGQGPSREAFDQRYADPATRSRRAEAITASLPSLSARTSEVTLVRSEDSWQVLETLEEDGARKALGAFLDAAEAQDFEAAWTLLGEALRARYTPERLQQDFDAEPLAKERLARARAALAKLPVVEGEWTLFPLGDGRAVRLRLEGDGYRVVALE